MSGAVANWIGGLPAWLIGLFGLVFSFLIVFLFSSSPIFGNTPFGDCAKFDGQ
jgi:hypothetical protein